MVTGFMTNLLYSTSAGSFLLLGYFILPVCFLSLPDSFANFPMPPTSPLVSTLLHQEKKVTRQEILIPPSPLHQNGLKYLCPSFSAFFLPRNVLTLFPRPSYPSLFSHLPYLPTSDVRLLLILITIAMKLLFVCIAHPKSHCTIFTGAKHT